MKIATQIIILVISLLGSASVFSSSPDSALYSTDFELITFSKVENFEPVDSIDLFLAMNYKPLSGKEKLALYIRKLKEKVQDYPMNKKLKTIYNSVHDEFLSRYDEEAYFNDIFINGNYNCVSASALYALILEELAIEYQIKETPVHVYLIADPGSSTFLIETTLPGEKIVQYDQHLKSQYVEYLHNNKIISDSEFKNTSTDELFEKHYSKDKTISLKQLAGIQYYNKGIFLYEKQSYSEALVNFEKALLLNKDDMIRYMLNNSLINQLQMDNQQKKFNGITLARYVNVNDSNSLGRDYAKDYFQVVSSELVMNKPNISEYNRFFSNFSSHVKDSDLSEINRTYYFFMGYHHAVNYQYPEALLNLGKSYEINSENVLTRQLITECLTKYLVNDRNNSWTLDSLDRYFDRFPFLRKDNNLMGYAEFSYVAAVQNSLQEDNYETALAYFRKYESFLRENPGYQSFSGYRPSIYQQMAYYHMRTDRYDLAEQVLRKGIRTCGANPELKGMLKSVMSMRGGSYEFPELMDDNKPLKKYLLALAVAKDHVEETNAHPELIAGEWKFVLKGAAEDTAIIRIKTDNRLQISDISGTSTGTWVYDNSKGILHFSKTANSDFMNIIITRLLPGEIQGVLYEKKNYEKATDVIMVKKEFPEDLQ